MPDYPRQDEDGGFGKTFVAIAVVHLVLLGGLLLATLYQPKQNTDTVVWMSPGSFEGESAPAQASLAGNQELQPPKNEEPKQPAEPETDQQAEAVSTPDATPPPSSPPPVLEKSALPFATPVPTATATPRPTPKATPRLTPTPPPTPAPKPTPTPAPKLTPTPAPKPTPTPAPKLTPTPAPKLTPTPAPKPTPTPAPKPTPTPAPKLTPTPAPKPAPTPTPKPTPKPAPKPTPKSSPTHSPTPTSSPKPEIASKEKEKSIDDDSPKPRNSPVKSEQKEKPNSSPGPGARQAEAVQAKGKSQRDQKTPGRDLPSHSSGGTGGEGKPGGTADSGLAAYVGILTNRFQAAWNQPTSEMALGKTLKVTVRLKVEADGTVTEFVIIEGSGNAVVDDSVREAGKKITKLPPPPNGQGFSAPVRFELGN